MLKVYSFLCMFILLSIFATTKQSCASSVTPTKADDCKDDSLTQNDKDDYDYVHCCYVKKEKGNAYCKALTSKQLDNLGKYIKHKEKDNDYEYKINIDCQSTYLHLFLFALIIQFILL